MADTDLPLDDDPAQAPAERIVRAMHRHLAHRLNDVPAHLLALAVEPMAPTGLAQRVAERCFGDASLVYDATRRLTEPGIHDVGVALDGATPGFAAPPGATLAHFIATRGQGVILLDDLQAFPEQAIRTLATMAATGRARAEGAATPTLPAERFAILAFARVALPSPRALAQQAGRAVPWAPGPDVPEDFATLLLHLAEQAHPEHFSLTHRARFGGVAMALAWARYVALAAAGAWNAPLVAPPTGAPVMAAPPAPAARDFVPDIDAIAEAAAAEPFDVFISYSWSHTAGAAEWLRDHLRALGFTVFFDKDHLDVAGVPDSDLKPLLIGKLRALVAASRAWVAFAITLQPFEPPPGMSEAEALRRGLAMALDAPWGHITVAWSWQRLETQAMGRRIVVGRHAAYVLEAGGQVDEAFGYALVDTHEALAAQVMRYLAEQGVEPRATR